MADVQHDASLAYVDRHGPWEHTGPCPCPYELDTHHRDGSCTHNYPQPHVIYVDGGTPDQSHPHP